MSSIRNWPSTANAAAYRSHGLKTRATRRTSRASVRGEATDVHRGTGAEAVGVAQAGTDEAVAEADELAVEGVAETAAGDGGGASRSSAGGTLAFGDALVAFRGGLVTLVIGSAQVEELGVLLGGAVVVADAGGPGGEVEGFAERAVVFGEV